MSLTLLQIAGLMADELDIDQPTTLQGSISAEYRRMKNNINRAYNLIRMKLNKKNENAETTGTITTVAGQEAYDFPDGMLKIYALVAAGDSVTIEMFQWTDYLDYKADTLTITENGSPDRATIYQRKVYFYPIPDTSYTITAYGYESLVDLSADDDEPDLPGEFHRCIFELALFYQMSYENNPRAGDQQFIAKEAFDAVKANMKGSWTDAPRIKGAHERQNLNYTRRITR